MQASYLLLTAVGADARFNTYFEVDSKAMRKVVDGDDLIDVLEAPATSDGLTLTSVGRFLVKLH